MTKINILYLTHRRLEFSDALLNILSRADKNMFHLSVSTFTTSWNFDNVKKIVEKANSLGISASLFAPCESANLNYINKVKAAVDLPYEYSIKLDEDIFISHHVFNYLFNEGCQYLDNTENLLVTPALSNGIPSVQHFMDSYLNDDEKKQLFETFSKSKIPHKLWGVDWSKEQISLNKGYNHDDWYNTVANNPHYYKGIHPIRYDWNSQLLMNQYIQKYIHKFNDSIEFNVEEVNRPYFCNSVFLIKTSEWKKIVQDKSLYVDDFDEVPLNRYWKQSNKKLLCIKNAFGIHTMYNTLEDVPKRDAAEFGFYRSFKDLI